MDLPQAKELARQLMDQHGVTQTGWVFQWSNGKRQLGSCQMREAVSGPRKGERVKSIKLSRHLVRLNDDDEVRDTILHEIAHALAGLDHGHDDVWKATCLRIGAKPDRTAGKEVKTVQGRYSIVCQACQKVVGTRHRRMDPKRLKQSYCKSCGIKAKGMLKVEDVNLSPKS
jgi:predicted SprT family Zn-dependent metalloprotease